MSTALPSFARVNRDKSLNHLHVTDASKIPIYNHLGQVGDEPGMEGDIVLDRSTQLFCYHNGTTWVCLSGAVPGVTSLTNVGFGATVGPVNNDYIVYNGAPNLPNTDPAQIRTIYGAENAAVAPTFQAEDVMLNDGTSNPNPETDGNQIGVPIPTNLELFVDVAGSDTNDGMTLATPVATLQRAFEILRFRSFVESAEINLSAGTFVLPDETLNLKVGQRGRLQSSVLIRGAVAPIGGATGVITGVTADPNDGLRTITTAAPSFTAADQGRMIEIIDLTTNRFIIGNRPDAVDPNVSISVATRSGIPVFATYQIYSRNTILSFEKTSILSDHTPMTFENILFDFAPPLNRSAAMTIEEAHIGFNNCEFRQRTNRESTLDFTDCIVNTLQVVNDVPVYSSSAGIFFNETFIGQADISNKLSINFTRCLVNIGNSVIEGRNGNDGGVELKFEQSTSNITEIIAINNDPSLPVDNGTLTLFNAELNISFSRGWGVNVFLQAQKSIITADSINIDNTVIQQGNGIEGAIHVLNESALSMVTYRLEGFNDPNIIAGVQAEASTVELQNLSITNITTVSGESRGLNFTDCTVRLASPIRIDTVDRDGIICDGCNVHADFSANVDPVVAGFNIAATVDEASGMSFRRCKLQLVGRGTSDYLVMPFLTAGLIKSLVHIEYSEGSIIDCYFLALPPRDAINFGLNVENSNMSIDSCVNDPAFPRFAKGVINIELSYVNMDQCNVDCNNDNPFGLVFRQSTVLIRNTHSTGCNTAGTIISQCTGLFTDCSSNNNGTTVGNGYNITNSNITLQTTTVLDVANNNGRDGINIIGSSNVYITGNGPSISNNSGDGISMSGSMLTIDTGSLNQNGSNGIQMGTTDLGTSSSYLAAANISIDSSGGHGILMDGSWAHISDSIIQNNGQGSPFGDFDGIHCVGGCTVRVSNVTSPVLNDRYGIFLDNNSHVSGLEVNLANQISGNTDDLFVGFIGGESYINLNIIDSGNGPNLNQRHCSAIAN